MRIIGFFIVLLFSFWMALPIYLYYAMAPADVLTTASR